MLHIIKGPVRNRLTKRIDRKEKKTASSRIQNHGLSVMRRVLYHCAATTTPNVLANKKVAVYVLREEIG